MLILKSDRDLLTGLGDKIKRLRLDCNWTREQMAERSGIPYSTLRRLESTGEGSMHDYIKALRALAALPDLAELLEPPPISPYELIRLQGKQRSRATGSRTQPRKKPQPHQQPLDAEHA